MSSMSVNDVLSQMRVMASQAQGIKRPEADTASVSFSGSLKSAVDQVNQVQQETSRFRTAF